MIKIGAFEAKTHLSSLLERAAAGEDVVITKHGKALARLVGAGDAETAERRDVLERLKRARRGMTLGGLSWRELRDEGRRG